MVRCVVSVTFVTIVGADVPITIVSPGTAFSPDHTVPTPVTVVPPTDTEAVPVE
jgi:hypothetical protein